jgi:HlyD family secretion protein
VFPNELLAVQSEEGMSNILAGQTKLFEAQRGVLEGQLKQLRERIGQINEEIDGLGAQAISKEKQIELIDQELVGLKKLQQEGLVQTARVLALEREGARLVGERGELKANIAKSKGQIGEINLQIIQLDDDYRGKVLNELRDVEGKIREYQERRIAIKATIDRTTVTAPISGYVHQLSVHTVGGVIAPGEMLMMIVPVDDRILVEAHIRPQDIEQVSVGQDAVVHFPGVENRLTPQLHGRVIYVSADLTPPKQPGDQPYYEARLELDDAEIAKMGLTKLKPGMPSDAYLRTRVRSPLSYLIQPLADQVSRTFRER